MFIAAFMAIGLQLNTIEPTSEFSYDSYAVTSSSFTEASNVFVDASSGFSTTQEFSKCRGLNAFTIGIVSDGSFGEEADTALQTIFDEINKAFKNIDSNGLNPKPFTSWDEVNAFVASADYNQNALCFTYGWEKFSTEVSAREFSLDIRTLYEQSDMPDTNLPQSRFYDQKY